jgi:uncharacterized protein (DUF2062 family)
VSGAIFAFAAIALFVAVMAVGYFGISWLADRREQRREERAANKDETGR